MWIPFGKSRNAMEISHAIVTFSFVTIPTPPFKSPSFNLPKNVFQVTLWEDVAAREGKQLEEAFQNGGPVILACSRKDFSSSVAYRFQGIRVGDYGGRSLSTVSGSRLQLDPDIQEATALMNW